MYDDPGVTALSVSPPTMNEPLIDAASPAPIVFMQQTPKPSAHLPDFVPPISVHSCSV